MRRTLSTTARVRLFEAHGGKCHICGSRIGVGERWEVEHVIPVAMGGEDRPANMAPAHVHCHSTKTKDDVTRIAKAKRQQAKHIGAKTARNPMPGSKASRWKKKLSGEVVER